MERARIITSAPSSRSLSWLPSTLRAWPGTVAAVLTVGHERSGVSQCAHAGQPGLAWSAILEDILNGPGRIEGVVVAGCDPTDDPDLPSTLAALRETGVPVRLETSGLRPDVLRHLLAEELVTSVALTVASVPWRYDELTGRRDAAARVAESVERLIRSGIEHEFRTVVDTRSVALEELPRIARGLQGGWLYSLERPARPRARSGAAAPTAVQLRNAAFLCREYLPTVVRDRPWRSAA